jgi:hypothetical protein
MLRQSVRFLEILYFCVILTLMGNAQVGIDGTGVPGGGSHNNDTARPRIFEFKAVQPPQLVASGRGSGEIASASFRYASGEELEGMEKTLQKYTSAFENLSLPEIREIWPNLDRQHESAFKSVFAGFRATGWSRSLCLKCAMPKVVGETANIECLETVTYGKPKGKMQQAGPTRVAIFLRGGSSNWVVSDMKGAK